MRQKFFLLRVVESREQNRWKKDRFASLHLACNRTNNRTCCVERNGANMRMSWITIMWMNLVVNKRRTPLNGSFHWFYLLFFCSAKTFTEIRINEKMYYISLSLCCSCSFSCSRCCCCCRCRCRCCCYVLQRDWKSTSDMENKKEWKFYHLPNSFCIDAHQQSRY